MRLIDADFLKEWVDEYLSVFKKYDKSTIKGFVDHAPTIEPKRGEWISKDPHWHTAICSNCNKVTMFEEWDEKVIEYNFCPNCGAKMDGERKESE